MAGLHGARRRYFPKRHFVPDASRTFIRWLARGAATIEHIHAQRELIEDCATDLKVSSATSPLGARPYFRLFPQPAAEVLRPCTSGDLTRTMPGLK